MRADEILCERVINAFDPALKQQYARQVWDLLQRSYAQLPGGFASASSVDELISDSGLWKIITRSGQVTAAAIYKDKYGRKSIAAGTDGTPQGKQDYRMIKDEDHRLQRSWAEVSGAPEAIMKKSGARPIPAKYAAALTGKEILEYHPDGVHYTRLIAGHPHEKIIYGTVRLSSEDRRRFALAGIDLQALPENFQNR